MMSNFIEINGLDYDSTSVSGSTLVTFDMHFSAADIAGSAITGALIDLAYSYSSVSDAAIESTTFGALNKDVWSNIVPNMFDTDSASGNGKIALTANFDTGNPIIDVGGKVLEVTLVVDGVVDSSSFLVGLESSTDGGTNSITTADGSTHDLDGGALVTDGGGTQTGPSIDVDGISADTASATEEFLDFETATPTTTPTGSTYVASVVETINGQAEQTDLFDSTGDGLPDSYIGYYLDDNGDPITEEGTITVGTDNSVTLSWMENSTVMTESGRLALSSTGDIVGFYMPTEETSSAGDNDFVEINNLNYDSTSVSGSTLVTFDMHFSAADIAGSAITGALIDLAYSYSSVSDAAIESTTFGALNKDVWSNIVPNMFDTDSASGNGKIALTANFDTGNPIIDVGGKVLEVTLVVDGVVDSSSFLVGLESSTDGGTNSITTADGSTHDLDGGALVTDGGGTQTGPSIDVDGISADTASATEEFLDFETATPTTTPTGSTYVASVVETINGQAEQTDLFDSTGDGLPDSYIGYYFDDNGDPITEEGTITVGT